ncbi:MAG: LysE family translocator [Pseudomonadales bacterium]
MSYELLIGLIAFAFVTSITPGPNNLMLMASGVNFGFRRSIPHMLGVGFGFMFMVIIVGAGLMQVFEAHPVSYNLLKVASVTYLLYLAWKIAHAAPPEGAQEAGTPITFFQAALFQWVNPKAWAMALTAISVYSPTQTLEKIALVAFVFGVINLPSVSTWTILGQQMRRVLTNPVRLRSFNVGMALLLVASLYPVLFL